MVNKAPNYFTQLLLHPSLIQSDGHISQVE